SPPGFTGATRISDMAIRRSHGVPISDGPRVACWFRSIRFENPWNISLMRAVISNPSGVIGFAEVTTFAVPAREGWSNIGRG
ncbi:hypothetical protein, partial [Streptomyces sp. I8-5]|uniref:hypothetical protein n=1 Tax=Streptomyces sp. I8-5 TaxID=3104277 RepID=UPI00386E9D90